MQEGIFKIAHKHILQGPDEKHFADFIKRSLAPVWIRIHGLQISRLTFRLLRYTSCSKLNRLLRFSIDDTACTAVTGLTASKIFFWLQMKAKVSWTAKQEASDTAAAFIRPKSSETKDASEIMHLV